MKKTVWLLLLLSLAGWAQPPEVLWNEGVKAQQAGNYAQALGLWQKYRATVPDDARGRAKVIQTLQAMGRNAEVEKQVAELVALWKAGKITDKIMLEEHSFVRAQFEVGGRPVMVFQFFAPNFDQREHTYDFMVLDKTTGSATLMLDFMYDKMAAAATEGKSGHDWYFDRKGPGGNFNLAILSRQPTYAEAFDLVRRYLGGEKIGPYKVIDLP